MVPYKDLCETLYREWRKAPKYFSEFDSDFNMFSLPEPYYPLEEGRNPLVVLNNNPGGVLDFQHHDFILKEFSDGEDYSAVARWLMKEYGKGSSVIGGAGSTQITEKPAVPRAAAALSRCSEYPEQCP